MNTVWLLVFYSIHAGSVTSVVEFPSEVKCKAAAVTLVKAVNDDSRWGTSLRYSPICVKIEK